MTNEEFRKVEAWLYSIPRVRISLETLEIDLERLDTKAASPPTWMTNLNAVPVVGGDQDSRQAKWMEFMDEYHIRRNDILERIQERQQQLLCFEKVLDMLRAENAQLAQLVRKKYIEKIQPDRIIWETVLFVGHSKFYEMRRYVVQAFFECLPGQFKVRIKCGQKTA
ncbi:MAG: hypothetical protein K6T65_14755 [Peptococcaceae bacterium]|nr:hypothetical protein [Peptococcaceae bacterium]